MKAYLLVKDFTDFQFHFNTTGLFETVLPYIDEKESGVLEGGSVLVLSDELVDSSELLELRNVNSQSEIVYLISNKPDAKQIKKTQGLCAANNIKFVTPYKTVQQVADEIIRFFFKVEDKQNQVVAAISTLPQQGLTSSLLHLAKRIGELTNIQIGVLGLNCYNPGDLLLKYDGSYFSDVWGLIDSRQLTQDELVRRMHHILPNVRYLAGNMDLKQVYIYDQQSVAWLIQEAQQKFDLLFLDCGCYLDNLAAAQGVYIADYLIIHTDQSSHAKSHFRRTFDQILQPILNIKLENALLLVNKVMGRVEMETPEQIRAEMGVELIGSLPYDQSFFISEQTTSLSQHSKEYEIALEKMAKGFIEMYELPLKQELQLERKKSGLFSKVFRGNTA